MNKPAKTSKPRTTEPASTPPVPSTDSATSAAPDSSAPRIRSGTFGDMAKISMNPLTLAKPTTNPSAAAKPAANPSVAAKPAANPPAAAKPTANPPAAAKPTANPPAAAKTPLPAEQVAVLELSEAGEILAARDACRAVFGREPGSLVGRNIRILLKDGLDNDVGRFLHRHLAGQNPPGTTDLSVQALRKDGSEFPALVTTLTCNWDPSITKKGDTSRLCWTAAFQVSGVEPKPAPKGAIQAKPPAKGPAAKPRENTREVTATTPPAVSPPQVSAPPVSPPSASPVQEPPQERKEPQAEATPELVSHFDPKRRIAELEEELNKAAADLATAKEDSEKVGSREAELQAQLNAAKEAAGQAEAALQEESASRQKLAERLQNLSDQLRLEQAERSRRFEEELVGLRTERDELNSQLEAEQKNANESTQRAKDLEALLKQNSAEAENAKAELERQAAEHQQSESSFREQLDTAWVAKKELEGAWDVVVEHNKRIEEELAKLRQQHEELSQKMAAEQKAAADSTVRAKEFEGRLNRNAADSDRARSELEKQNAERDRVDSEWRKQLDAAKSLKAKLERSLSEATERAGRLESELAALRQERDELLNRMEAEQNTAVESGAQAGELQRRADQYAAEVERLMAELKQQSAAREQAELRASEQQEIATSLTQKQNKKTAERDRVDVEWRKQLNTAKSLKAKLERSLADATERAGRLESELVALRQDRDELLNRMEAEQKTAVESGAQAGELQRRADQYAAEVERLMAELNQQCAAREQAEMRASEQQEIATSLTQKQETDWAEAVERNMRLEEELTQLLEERDELVIQLKAEQQASADTTHQVGELQRRLERVTAELDRATAEVERGRSERESADSKWREQLEAAKALARKLDAAWTGATERNRRFEGDTVILRQEREELQGRLAAAQREAEDFRARTDELERRVNRMAAEIERVNSEPGDSLAEPEDFDESEPPTPPTPRSRRESNQRNGHGSAKTAASKAASAASRARAAARPVPEPEEEYFDPEPEPDFSTPPPQGLYPAYSFGSPASPPAARRRPTTSKKRAR